MDTSPYYKEMYPCPVEYYQENNPDWNVPDTSGWPKDTYRPCPETDLHSRLQWLKVNCPPEDYQRRALRTCKLESLKIQRYRIDQFANVIIRFFKFFHFYWFIKKAQKKLMNRRIHEARRMSTMPYCKDEDRMYEEYAKSKEYLCVLTDFSKAFLLIEYVLEDHIESLRTCNNLILRGRRVARMRVKRRLVYL